MRQTSHPAYNNNMSPYGYQTMMTGKHQVMGAGYGMTMGPAGGQQPQPGVAGMMTSQPNFPMDYSGQTMMPTMAHAQSAGTRNSLFCLLFYCTPVD